MIKFIKQDLINKKYIKLSAQRKYIGFKIV